MKINKILKKSQENRKTLQNFKMIQKVINQDKININFNKNKIIISIMSPMIKTIKIMYTKTNNPIIIINRTKAITIIMNLVRNF